MPQKTDTYPGNNIPINDIFRGQSVYHMSITKAQTLKNLRVIPGVGPSIAEDLWNIGIQQVSDLRGRDPESLYDQSNHYAGVVQDRCLLYVFRCAVYYAETPASDHDPEMLKWWWWKEMSHTPHQ